MTRRHVSAVLGGLTLLALSSGCGRRTDENKIEGKVSYRNTPIVAGAITFVDEQGNQWSGAIKDGVYQVRHAGVGVNQVAIESHDSGPPPGLHVKNAPNDSGPALRTPAVKLPPHYAKPETSGLTYTVRKGQQKYDFNLDP